MMTLVLGYLQHCTEVLAMVISLLCQRNTSFSFKDSTLIQAQKMSENKGLEMENRSATSAPNSPSRNLIKTAKTSSAVERHFFLPLEKLSELLRRWRATIMYGSINLRSAMKTPKVGSPV